MLELEIKNAKKKPSNADEMTSADDDGLESGNLDEEEGDDTESLEELAEEELEEGEESY